MTCDLQAIRERVRHGSFGRWCYTTTGRDDIRALLAEVDRLRAAIEQRDTTLRECRSFLADLSGDYSLEDHAFTHVLFTGLTERIDAALDPRPCDTVPAPPARQPDRALRGYIEQANRRTDDG